MFEPQIITDDTDSADKYLINYFITPVGAGPRACP